MSPATATRVEVAGELTVHTAADQKARLVTALEQADALEVDLAGVTELDTAGLQVLLLLRQEAAAAGKPLLFTGHPQQVLDLLALARRSAQLADSADTEEGAPQ